MDENDKQEEPSLEQLQTDLEVATNNWKRTLADFENYKRRKEAENKELVEFAREVTVAKLLPTLDSLEQALRHAPDVSRKSSSPSSHQVEERHQEFEKKYENWMAGINGIVIQLDQALSELGVKKIEAVGKKFDPHFHEAVKEVEGEEDGVVKEELQAGFEINGKVIRPSQVVISKKK